MNFLKTKRFALLGAILGAALGYAYWYTVGCAEGCTIQSVWWRMSLWGAVMGFLTIEIITDFLNTKQKRQS